MTKDISVHSEATPNPRTMKFVAGEVIANETLNVRSPTEAERSPLANKLFGFPWVESIFVGSNFVSITKQDWVDWDVLSEPLIGLIKEHLDEGLPVVLPPRESTSESPNTKAAEDGDGVSADDEKDPIIKQIKEIIENEIRPAVAQDGGDIIFKSYENNRVHLLMRGACSGCPSSTYTLKVGIETRLREAIPEIQEVVAD